MQRAIFDVAIVFAVLCFGAYLWVTLKHIPDAQKKADQAVKQLSPTTNVAGVSAQDVADMIKALASLADSLVKAGPALWSLIGSMLFLLIASLAAGLIGGSGSGTSPKPSSKVEKPANTGAGAASNVQGNAAQNTATQ